MLHKLDFNKLEDSISWISELFFCVTTFFQVSDHAGPHYVSLRGDLCRPSWNNICIQNPRPPVSSFGYPVHGGTRQPREPNGPFDTIWFCETHLRYSEITINVLIVDYIPRTPLPTQIILLECWKNTTPLPRTALATILRGDAERGWLALYALKCSSWTAVNQGTSSRSPCSSIGNTEFQSVREGNCLASRTFACM